MISRVAENCFWLNRYIERAESTARVASVNRFMVLDADIHDAERWKPVLAAVGEQDRFERLFGADAYDSDKTCEAYLTWSEDNPVSIKSSLYYARENARMTREVISREMWETVNTWWQWLNSRAARNEYVKDRIQFYQRVQSMAAEFQGVCHNTMLHEEPFDFMRLGMLLERVNQTARLMDVKHHWLTAGDAGGPREAAQWVAILRMCSAAEPFFKRHRAAPTATHVAEFLLKDTTFPRAVLHCGDRAVNFLKRIDKNARRSSSSTSTQLARGLATRLRKARFHDVLAKGLHEELTHVIVTAAAIGGQLRTDFFDPPRPGR